MTLDAHMYPHIVDLIVDLALPTSLVPLRHVSQRLRTIADKRLVQHVAVKVRHGAVDVSPYGTSLTLPWLDDANDTTYVRSLMDHIQVIDVPFTNLDDASEETLKESTKILNNYLDGREHYVSTVRSLGLECENTIEWDGHGFETPVVFGNAAFNWPGRVVRVLEATSDQVVNGYNSNVSCVEDGENEDLIDSLILHLVQHTTPSEPSAAATSDPDHDPDQSILATLLLSNWDETRIFVTVVGGAQALRGYLRLDPTASTHEFEAALDAFDERVDSYYKWRDFISFLSPEQYMATVENSTVVLETQRDLLGPPVVYLD